MIVCHSDEEWRRLVEVMGAPAWARDERYATNSGRLEHQEALDAASRPGRVTLEQVRHHRALPGRRRARACRSKAPRTASSTTRSCATASMYLPSSTIRCSATARCRMRRSSCRRRRPSIIAPSPLIGQHTAEIVEGLLGYSREELRDGFADGTFWPTKRPRFDYWRTCSNERTGDIDPTTYPGRWPACACWSWPTRRASSAASCSAISAPT